jgi:flotillin
MVRPYRARGVCLDVFPGPALRSSPGFHIAGLRPWLIGLSRRGEINCLFDKRIMNPHYMIIPAAVVMVLVTFVFVAIWASRYVKVGPNRVLVVSGRLRQLPDGTRVGFRIVKGGGTFVFPVIEKSEVLSLEVLTIEMPKCKARTAKGAAVEAECLAQVKIKGDDASILAAAEHFLSKSEGEMKNIVRPILEKHLRAVLGNLNVEEIDRDTEACAARVETAAAMDLGNLGLGMVSFTIRRVRG